MTVVLITGALTGIGRATALAFAKEGDQLVVSGRHGDTGAELVGEIRALGAEVEFICADVLRRSKVLRAACASTPWRRGRSRPRCSTASRAVAKGKLPRQRAGQAGGDAARDHRHDPVPGLQCAFLTGQSIVVDGGKTAA